ncbi:MAG: DUF262 domain-containing protein [Bryobacterales bacterium]|nr:DUF262 domain-containing protein [Bryobacterales bacterium]
MYQTGHTIEDTLKQIHKHDLVLPAIQREFVWRPDQICRLFDSLMQGFPFGTFLYWKVAPENSDKFNFYGFVLDYHERDNRHCPPLPAMPNTALTAVLDGQQRLTALNVGLQGSMTRKLPRLWWNNPEAFPKRHLYLDLLWNAGDDEEEGTGYRFSFRRENEPIQRTGPAGNGSECWFRVSDVLLMDGGPAMVRWLNERLDQRFVDHAYGTLDRLHRVVRIEHLVAFYEESRQTLDDVVQIFIRMNDGGTPLSHSDLLLSIAVAQWTKHDAREEIQELVDKLNRIGLGFSFSKDLVLKAGLMLSDIGSVGFKVDNFNRENMAILEEQWMSIKSALTLTVQLVAGFGFSRATLTAHNAILPIAYYVYRSRLTESFLSHSRHADDRRSIREWLMRSLLKSGVWGSGLDTLLTALRKVIRDDGTYGFPADRLGEEMARRGRELVFNDEEVEELADTEYSSPRVFAVLSLIFPFVDPGKLFHVDHIFPSTRFSQRKLLDAHVSEEKIEQFRDRANRLGNLQLLPGQVNTEKSATMPAEWLVRAYPDESQRRRASDDHLLGCVPEEMTGFLEFYNARRERLVERIKSLLGNDGSG